MIGRTIAPAARMMLLTPGWRFRKLRFQMIADSDQNREARDADLGHVSGGILPGCYHTQTKDSILKLNHIWLEPGAYRLQVQMEGQPAFDQRFYVLSRKTIHLGPDASQQ